jgi:predicted phosphodiesterase
LARIAPLVAIRGNNDLDWAVSLNDTEVMDVQNIRLYIIHDVNDLRIDLRAHHVQIVVSGHSHRPSLREKAGVLYVNPGSAGPRRFNLPVALGELLIQGGAVTARVVDLTSGQGIASQEYLRADLLDRHSV